MGRTGTARVPGQPGDLPRDLGKDLLAASVRSGLPGPERRAPTPTASWPACARSGTTPS